MIDVLSENDKFICRFVGKADFHGKTGTVELFEILTEKPELKEKQKSRIVSESVLAAEAETPKGRLIGDKYFIEKLIGEGAYGKVFKARHAESKDIVAIKMLPEDAYSFYSREAQVLRQLQPCPYIMSIIDAFVDQEGLCIVMPYIEHGSLQTYMNKLHGDPLEPGQTISLMEELLLGISHAHSRDVIHRDVKPQNILLGNGTDGILTDFGVAYAMESTGRTTTMTAGTSGYIAPEVTSGRFDSSIDVYSAGVVLYKMLGGEFPVDMQTLPPYTHPDFVKIIGRSIADRSRRYSKPEDMLEDLRSMGSKVLGSTIQFHRAVRRRAGAGGQWGLQLGRPGTGTGRAQAEHHALRPRRPAQADTLAHSRRNGSRLHAARHVDVQRSRPGSRVQCARHEGRRHQLWVHRRGLGNAQGRGLGLYAVARGSAGDRGVDNVR